MKIRNAIFDWSGTLSDDLVQGYTATMNVFRRLGVEPLSFEAYRREFTLPYMDFYNKFVSLSEEELRSLFLDEISRGEEPDLFPQVRELLCLLRERGVRMAILSSHPQEKLEQEVRGFGLQGWFIAVHGSVHDKTGAIRGILETADFLSSETVYIGDMTHDMEAGKGAEVLTIGVTWGYQTREKLSSCTPDFLVDDREELKELLFRRIEPPAV
ncbi:MAG: HAD family hydrolase [Nitrospirales bacterium]|nr:HAD family hydrolase [Nitrospirales bacterium]